MSMPSEFFFCDLFTEDDDEINTFGLWLLVLVFLLLVFFVCFVLLNIL